MVWFWSCYRLRRVLFACPTARAASKSASAASGSVRSDAYSMVAVTCNICGKCMLKKNMIKHRKRMHDTTASPAPVPTAEPITLSALVHTVFKTSPPSANYGVITDTVRELGILDKNKHVSPRGRAGVEKGLVMILHKLGLTTLAGLCGVQRPYFEEHLRGRITNLTVHSDLLAIYSEAWAVYAPPLKLKPATRTWKGFSDNGGSRNRQRHKWPFPVPRWCRVDLSGFLKYLPVTKASGDNIMHAHARLVQRFWYLFEPTPPPLGELPATHQARIVATTSRSDVFEELMNLHIMDRSHKHARKLCDAMIHYVAHLVRHCIKSGNCDWGSSIQYGLGACMQAWKTKIGNELGTHRRAVDERDHAAMAAMPGAADIQRACHKAMCLMVYLSTMNRPYPSTTNRPAASPRTCDPVEYAAMVVMCGLIFLNAFAGRPGGWEALTVEYVEEFLTRAPTLPGIVFLVLRKHKTQRTWGCLGRYVPPGNLRCMELFMAVVHRHSPRDALWLKHRRASDLLEKFWEVFLPGSSAAAATVIRKTIKNKCDDDPDASHKAWFNAVFAAADGQSEKVLRSHYIKKTPQKEAELLKKTFARYAFEPVEWPSDQEARQQTTACEQIMHTFFDGRGHTGVTNTKRRIVCTGVTNKERRLR